MPEPRSVLIPQLNPNEIEVRLASLPIRNGMKVNPGDILAIVETTKSTSELAAETSGYVVDLAFDEGDTAHSGDLLCYLGETEVDRPAREKRESSPQVQAGLIPPGLRITRPALALALENALDLAALPQGPLITEAQVKARLPHVMENQATLSLPALDFNQSPPPLVVYGGGGHGKSVIELVQRLGSYRVIGVIDDGLPVGSQVLDVPVLGGNAALEELARRGLRLAINAVGGIGNISTRLKIFALLQSAGVTCPTVIHPAAFVETSASLAEGIQVFPHAYIGSSSHVGYGVIVNTGAILSHDCAIGDYTNISPGAILAGGVTVGQRNLIGMAVTINLGVAIGNEVRIGNGATIKADVPDGCVVHAGAVWPPAK